MIQRNADLLKGGISTKLLQSCINEHLRDIAQRDFDKLDNYYKGKQSILNRSQDSDYVPNNKIVGNYCKYITDTVTGYFSGNPIKYESDKDLTALKDVLDKADVNTHDSELSKDLSVFGTGIELIYFSNEKEVLPKLALIDPRTAFVVYDDTIEVKPLFGCRYYPLHDETGTISSYIIEVSTDRELIKYKTTGFSLNTVISEMGREYHNIPGVPIVQYWNNEEGMGDFEGIISLQDAYNILSSDRVNDKERFVDAILLFINTRIGDDDEKLEAAKEMLKNRILEIPDEADARYITKSLNENETQVLANALKEDIHKFSQTPDFSDKNFAGNASGVAMAYKLLSLENLAKVKERFFRSGLRQRLKLIIGMLNIKGHAGLDPKDIKITFIRTYPVNELELAQIVSLLTGKVSNQTLLALLPFVEDSSAESEAVKKEKEESQQSMIGSFNTQRINNDDEEL